MRKYILLLPVLALFWACDTDSKSDGPLDQLSIKLDTVMIDAGDDYIDLRTNFNKAKLSPDKKYIYNFVQREITSIDLIDLETLKLIGTYPFEREGPNGLGDFMASYNITKSGNVLIWHDGGFYKYFNLDGKIVEDLPLDKIAPNLFSAFKLNPNEIYEHPSDPMRKLLFLQKGTSKYSIMTINLSDSSYNEISINELSKLKEYDTKINYENGMSTIFVHSAHASFNGDKMILSSDIFNEIHIYNIEKDTLYTKDLSTALLGSKRGDIPPKEVNGSTGMYELIKTANEAIIYGRFIWDADKKNFYRFSSKKYYNGAVDEYGQYISQKTDVYLSIFDQDFNLLAEALIPELNKAPSLHFIKGGKIWLFENMNDEVAFVRIDLSENKL